jgi:hypothetical protein
VLAHQTHRVQGVGLDDQRVIPGGLFGTTQQSQMPVLHYVLLLGGQVIDDTFVAVKVWMICPPPKAIDALRSVRLYRRFFSRVHWHW